MTKSELAGSSQAISPQLHGLISSSRETPRPPRKRVKDAPSEIDGALERDELLLLDDAQASEELDTIDLWETEQRIEPGPSKEPQGTRIEPADSKYMIVGDQFGRRARTLRIILGRAPSNILGKEKSSFIGLVEGGKRRRFRKDLLSAMTEALGTTIEELENGSSRCDVLIESKQEVVFVPERYPKGNVVFRGIRPEKPHEDPVVLPKGDMSEIRRDGIAKVLRDKAELFLLKTEVEELTFTQDGKVRVWSPKRKTSRVISFKDACIEFGRDALEIALGHAVYGKALAEASQTV